MELLGQEDGGGVAPLTDWLGATRFWCRAVRRIGTLIASVAIMILIVRLIRQYPSSGDSTEPTIGMVCTHGWAALLACQPLRFLRCPAHSE